MENQEYCKENELKAYINLYSRVKDLTKKLILKPTTRKASKLVNYLNKYTEEVPEKLRKAFNLNVVGLENLCQEILVSK